MKNKLKGFTVVELVIVIAVVAVLAAVAIPTFSSTVKRANISADTQAVRNMNVILTSESTEAPAPVNTLKLRELLTANGIGDFRPQTKFYTFYWIEDENVIVLANESDIAVYPDEYRDKIYTTKWHDLDEFVSLELPDREKPEEPREFTVTVTQSGSSVVIPFKNIPEKKKEGDEFMYSFLIPEEYNPASHTYSIKKITAIMRDAGIEHKIVLRSQEAENTGYEVCFGPTEAAVLSIPYVTGNIEINIDIVEWCHVTIKDLSADAGPHVDYYLPANSGIFIIGAQQYEKYITKGYKVASAKAYRNGEYMGELYNAKYDQIRYETSSLMEDFEIRLTLEERIYTVDMTIRDSADIIHKEKINVKYSDEHSGYVLSINLNGITGAENVTEILNNGCELGDGRYKPKFEYDPATNTITVTNIKCDFKWICYVKR